MVGNNVLTMDNVKTAILNVCPSFNVNNLYVQQESALKGFKERRFCELVDWLREVDYFPNGSARGE